MAATESITETQDEIVEEFEMLDEWTERYKYIIDLGRKLPELPDEFKTDEYKVRGCQSQVWLRADPRDDVIDFRVDSDAMIVRGLAALLMRVYSGRAPREILDSEPTFIERIGMGEHLSMTRANGLRAMVKQIKSYALGFDSLASDGTKP
jgi:cysteine desulfuration protein SufE